jgi:hypothetical protein
VKTLKQKYENRNVVINMWQSVVFISLFTIFLSATVRPVRSDGNFRSQKNQQKMEKMVKNDKIDVIYGQLKVIDLQIKVANQLKSEKTDRLNLKKTAPFCNEDYDFVVCRCPKTGRIRSKF